MMFLSRSRKGNACYSVLLNSCALAQSVVDGKNGAPCRITFDKAANTITVASNTAGRVGYLVHVNEGTVANGVGAPAQGADKKCGMAFAGNAVQLRVCLSLCGTKLLIYLGLCVHRALQLV
jgi:hypothetical protein